MNKKITFKSENNAFSESLKFIILYAISLFFNSTTHDYFLKYDIMYLPFISATIVSVIINFSGQKFWVFKKGSF
jgi:putative flippase GtrA